MAPPLGSKRHPTEATDVRLRNRALPDLQLTQAPPPVANTSKTSYSPGRPIAAAVPRAALRHILAKPRDGVRDGPIPPRLRVEQTPLRGRVSLCYIRRSRFAPACCPRRSLKELLFWHVLLVARVALLPA